AEKRDPVAELGLDHVLDLEVDAARVVAIALRDQAADVGAPLPQQAGGPIDDLARAQQQRVGVALGEHPRRGSRVGLEQRVTRLHGGNLRAPDLPTSRGKPPAATVNYVIPPRRASAPFATPSICSSSDARPSTRATARAGSSRISSKASRRR